MIEVTIRGGDRRDRARVLSAVAADPALHASRPGRPGRPGRSGPSVRMPYGEHVVVVSVDLAAAPSAATWIEPLARRHRVLAMGRSGPRCDLWLLRSIGVRGFVADSTGAAETAGALRRVAHGDEHWPAEFGTAPDWIEQPLVRRICTFVRVRERARLSGVLHEDVVRMLEDLAVSPGFAPVAARLLAQEAERMRQYAMTGEAAGTAGSDLGAELKALAARVAGNLRVDVVFGGAEFIPCSPRVRSAVAAAANEALRNVVKHAGTRRAWLSVETTGRTVRVEIADRGRGFDPAAYTSGFGIGESIREQMRSAGGGVSILSSPGSGAIVSLTAPLT